MTTVALDTGVGPLLRGWREQRRISQLELALRADSSARHISFIETGRSRPSEEMILRLAEHLDIPVRERNALLVVGGYAPRFAQTALDDPSMGVLREAIDRLLAGYEPYPALVLDATYTVVAANRGMRLLLEGVSERLLTPPVNAMRLTLHPDGLAPRILNLPEWRADLLAQMERQIALVRSVELRALYDEVAAYPLPGQQPACPAGTVPVMGVASLALPLRITHGERELSFISSIATFNTPMDVTVAELAIETFLPADRETAAYLHTLTP
ncbi:helix-turn-helix transcriptional regulator [Streptomyces sp. NPDC005566]|uniref:helix-turn-helix domain-containing protein n=1 Tax=Streptomyces sp. NPDC005566 TaxID=3156886 RepID=UPI0033BAA273